MALPKASAVAAIALCGFVGAYGALYAGFQNGLFDSLTSCLRTADVPYIPGGPEPIKTRYTGVAAVDGHLLMLVGYFAALSDGLQGWDVTLPRWYSMGQICAAWPLLALEGLRRGNKGRVVSWTGTMGCIFQNLSYTVTVPLYLVLHLFTSPTATRATARKVSPFAVEQRDMALLPLCTLLGLVVPSIAISLPSPAVLSGPAHYAWIAFWQPFPAWQSILHWALRPGRQTSFSVPSPVYRFVLFFAVASQLPLLAVALAPASVLPSALASVTLRSVFLPHPFWATPVVVDAFAQPIPPDALPPLCLHLLRWDLYGGSSAVLAWALYLYYCDSPVTTRKNLLGLTAKALGWTVLGGPIAAAAAFLWARDEAAEPVTGEKKSN